MNQREAKRQACRVVSNLITEYLDRAYVPSGTDDDRLDKALDEIGQEMARRAGGAQEAG